MYDTGNGHGTWYIYYLSTDCLTRRNKFTILPIPDLVRNHLNNMRTQKVDTTTLIYRYGFTI